MKSSQNNNKPFILGGKLVYKCQNVMGGVKCNAVIRFRDKDDYPICPYCLTYLNNFKPKKEVNYRVKL